MNSHLAFGAAILASFCGGWLLKRHSLLDRSANGMLLVIASSLLLGMLVGATIFQ